MIKDMNIDKKNILVAGLRLQVKEEKGVERSDRRY